MSSPFGDVMSQFSNLYQTLTVQSSSMEINDEGYIKEDFDTAVEIQGVLIPRKQYDFIGSGFEIKGEVFLYVSTNQENWPGLAIGDLITDANDTTWKVVSERDYNDTGYTKIFGLEKDVK